MVTADPTSTRYLALCATAHSTLGTFLTNLGRYEDAKAHQKRASDILAKVVQLDPDPTMFQAMVLQTMANALVSTLYTGASPGLNDLAIKIESGLERLVRKHPENLGYRSSLAVAYQLHASRSLSSGRKREAREWGDRELGLIHALRAVAPTRISLQASEAVAARTLAERYLSEGDERKALETLEHAAADAERLMQRVPEDINFKGVAAVAFEQMGNLQLRTGKHRKAEEGFLRAASLLKEITRVQPENVSFQGSLASSFGMLGLARMLAGRYRDADEAYREAIAVREQLQRSHPDDALNRSGLATDYSSWGLACIDAGRYAEAERCFEQQRALLEALLAQDPGNASYKLALSNCFAFLAKCLIDGGRAAEAVDPSARARQIRAELVAQPDADDETRIALVRSLLQEASILTRLGHLADAGKSVDQAVASAEALAKKSADHVDFHRVLAEALIARGDWHRAKKAEASAQDDYRRAIPAFEAILRTQPDDSYARNNLALAHQALGEIALNEGRDADALTAFTAVYRLRSQRLGASPENPVLLEELVFAIQKAIPLWEKAGKLDQVEALRREALRHLDLMVKASGADASPLHRVGVRLNNLGKTPLTKTTQDEIERLMNKALVRLRKLATKHPKDVTIAYSLADTQFGLGIFHERTSPPDVAERTLSEARKLYLALNSLESASRQPVQTRAKYHSGLGQVCSVLAAIQAEAARPADALDSARAARSAYRAMLELVPTSSDGLQGAMLASGRILQAELDLKRYPDAVRDYQESEAIFRKILEPDPSNLTARRCWERVCSKFGYVQAELGHHAEAVETFGCARDMSRALLEANPDDPLAQAFLAEGLASLGQSLIALNRDRESLDVLCEARAHATLALERIPDNEEFRWTLHNACLYTARACRKLRRVQDAAAATLERRRVLPREPFVLTGVSRGLALLVPLVGRDKASLSAVEQAEREHYADLAISALRDAVGLGFRNVEVLRDSDFDPVRHRADFQALLLDAAMPVDPFAK